LVLAAYAVGGVTNLGLLHWGLEPGGLVVDLVTVASVFYQLWIIRRVIRAGRRRLDAASLAANWLFLLVAMIGGHWLGAATLMPLAWLVFLVTQAIMLVRANAATLRNLNAELAERLNDVAALNDELRRQVGDRSARLVEAISRLGSSGVTEDLALKPGQTIGDRYRIVRDLGTGAMATVCEVSRMSDGRRFALKMIRRVGGTTSLARFAREAQIAARVVHPNVVGVVDFDVTPGGLPFMVMDLVKGAVATGGDDARCLDVLAQAAEGLAALHAAGIVHRDLKPSNVLVEELAGGGVRARIADFGISRFDENVDLTDEAGARDDDLPPASLTRTGVVVGTPMYIAPELARGSRDALPSSDLWSFGVLAYELLTGSRPFTRPPVIEMLRRDGADALHLEKQKLPEVARAIVAQCLQLDPTERPTAAEVARVLGAARRGPGPSAALTASTGR
jgi:serine/threonine-protein kinase